MSTLAIGTKRPGSVLKTFQNAALVVIDDEDAAPGDPAVVAVHDVETERLKRGDRCELVWNPSGWLGDWLLLVPSNER